MNKRKNNINNFLAYIEKEYRSVSDLKLFEELKLKIKNYENELNKLTKRELIEKFKDDLISLDNSNKNDIKFLQSMKVRLNDKRKRKAS